MKQFLISAAILWLAASLSFAQQPPPKQPPSKQPPAPPSGQMKHETVRMGTPIVEHAVCVLYPTQGNNAHGTVTFDAAGKGVRVVLDMQGLAPGKHGFHVHEFGDCTARDAASAGGHYNPEQKAHGAPTDQNRHAGDLGNITADSNGNAHLEWTDNVMTLRGPHSIIGHAVVIHEKEDDLKSQPSGESGPRVACGVIGIANKPTP